MRVSSSILISLLVIAMALAIRAADPVPLQTFRGTTFDFYQHLKPRPYRSVGVRVIDIDDESLKRIGQWPTQAELTFIGIVLIKIEIDFTLEIF